ncbi:hypothetical protein AVEN_134126-1, partial [Araneus ventricosus]
MALFIQRYKSCSYSLVLRATRNQIPAIPKHPGHLNDSCCNSSSTEAGVLIGHGPTPPEG